MILPLKTELNDENPGWPVANVALLIATASLLLVQVALSPIWTSAEYGMLSVGVNSALYLGTLFLFALFGNWPALMGLLCLAGFGNALNRRLGDARYLCLCGAVAIITAGLGHDTIPHVAVAVGMGVAGATLTLMPFATVTILVWIHPLITAGIVTLFGANLGSLMFLCFVSILYWIYVLRSWDWFSARQLVGDLLFLRAFGVRCLWAGTALLAFTGYLVTLPSSSNPVSWAPLAGACIGIVVAAIANLSGESGRSDSTTLLEWLESIGADAPAPGSNASTQASSSSSRRITVRAGFAD